MTLGQRSVERLHLLRQMEEQMNFSVRSVTEDGQAYLIEETHGGVGLRAEIEDFDKYSCRLRSLTLTVDRSTPSGEEASARLMEQANAISETIHYLSEDLALIELDKNSKAAQLRSKPPQQKGDTSTYYELMLYDGIRANLRRYTQRKDEHERQGVAISLTEEIFERLINDLEEIMIR